jgi:hypothetical protein
MKILTDPQELRILALLGEIEKTDNKAQQVQRTKQIRVIILQA